MFRGVLVADSDVESRDRLYELLFSMGYKVDCAPNNKEAFARLQVDRPYLLVLDENLATDGGLATLEKVRQFDRGLKVVFLTKGEAGPETQLKLNRLGVSVVIKKDFTNHLMFKKILEILSEPEESVKENKYIKLGKVLVVDDNSELRVALTTFLKLRGFDVKDASNGDQALMEIKTDKPRLVLLDERMPGMDGLMTLRKIKELGKEIKVVMLTAIEDEDIIKEAMGLGACDYVIKPCDLEKLEALVLSILIPEKY